MSLLKEWNAPICYDKKGYTYYYTTDFNIEISISVSILKEGEIIKIYGGHSFLQKSNRLQGFGSERIYLWGIIKKILFLRCKK